MTQQVSNSLTRIVERMYAQRPTINIFHYASLPNVKNIISGRVLWASDIRYMSDASELGSTAKLIQEVSANLVHDGWLREAELLHQFAIWVESRFTAGHALFAACFSERGNLPSQWGGYCPSGNGYSLGCEPDDLCAAATLQAFSLVKFVYDRDEQVALLREVITAVMEHTYAFGQAGTSDLSPDNCYYPAFEALEFDLLKIAIALKHGAFYEEKEWCVVSEVITQTDDPSISYRPGASMLVPLMQFKLPTGQSNRLKVPQVFVGPTPHPNLAINAMVSFLSAEAEGTRKVWTADIPYRTW